MVEDEKTAQEELKEAAWEWTQKIVTALVLFFGGIVAAYFMWGDAAELRMGNKELQDQIVDLKNQRETLNTRIARELRDKEVCIRDMRELKKTAGAAAAAPPATAPAAAPPDVQVE
jgi:hypothetical protein